MNDRHGICCSLRHHGMGVSVGKAIYTAHLSVSQGRDSKLSSVGLCAQPEQTPMCRCNFLVKVLENSAVLLRKSTRACRSAFSQRHSCNHICILHSVGSPGLHLRHCQP